MRTIALLTLATLFAAGTASAQDAAKAAAPARAKAPPHATVTILEPKNGAHAPIPNDATHKHYGKGQTQDTIHLEPGDHTLQLDFADAAHMQFNPPIVSKKITVHVK